MAVARGTTPTFTLTFTDQSLDLTAAANVYVTFTSGIKILTKTGDDLTVGAKQIEVYLSQAETLSFGSQVKIQANWTTQGGDRLASDIVEYDFSGQLLERVVE